MTKVFISYRREDSRYQSRNIYNAFVKALPPGSVFMDVDSIPPGADFAQILEDWVKQCNVLLALIGPGWITSTDSATNLRRLDNPEDFVRIEIRGALQRNIPVVPVLLDGTKIPNPRDLPEDIKELTRRNAEFVDFRTFDTDVDRLIGKLKKRNGLGGDKHKGLPKSLLAAAAVVLLVAAGAAALWKSTNSRVETSAAVPARSEEMRIAAEARAQEAAAALAKSEQARQDAEAKAAAAAAAQAKAEQRAAEARASNAANALAISEQARRDAEAKAAAAADALEKSDQARRDAENAAAQARASAAQAKAAEPAPVRPASPPPSRTFLTDIGSRSRWVIGSASCADAKKAYSLTIGTASITWLSGEGNQDIESISSSSENEFRTITQSSAHMKPGQTWTYSRQGDRIRVDPGGRPAFTLTRCS
jgi:TIR domain